MYTPRSRRSAAPRLRHLGHRHLGPCAEQRREGYMSKSRSDDAPRCDWAALLAEVRDLDAPLTDEQKRLWQLGQYDGEANAWGADYVAALQAAIEGRKPGRLLDLLECEVPIPPMLLPALAAAMRMLLDRS